MRYWRRCGLVSALIVLAVGNVHCGTSRNCLVIPRQLELVKQRHDAAMTALETSANQVDRTRTSIANARERVQELEREKAILDSLGAASGR
jgi:hypothetical protein